MFLPPAQPWKPAQLFWWSNLGAGLVLLRWRMWSDISIMAATYINRLTS